jgi:hypothetical protein
MKLKSTTWDSAILEFEELTKNSSRWNYLLTDDNGNFKATKNIRLAQAAHRSGRRVYGGRS